MSDGTIHCRACGHLVSDHEGGVGCALTKQEAKSGALFPGDFTDEFTIQADGGPALFYLGSDGDLYRLDHDYPPTLNSDREEALCAALLRYSSTRITGEDSDG